MQYDPSSPVGPIRYIQLEALVTGDVICRAEYSGMAFHIWFLSRHSLRNRAPHLFREYIPPEIHMFPSKCIYSCWIRSGTLVTLISIPAPGPLGRAHISCKSRKCMRNCRRKSKVNSRFFFFWGGGPWIVIYYMFFYNFNHTRVAKIALETVQRERLKDSVPEICLWSYHQMTIAWFVIAWLVR